MNGKLLLFAMLFTLAQLNFTNGQEGNHRGKHRPHGHGPMGHGPPGRGPHVNGPPGHGPHGNGPPGRGPHGNGPPGHAKGNPRPGNNPYVINPPKEDDLSDESDIDETPITPFKPKPKPRPKPTNPENNRPSKPKPTKNPNTPSWSAYEKETAAALYEGCGVRLSTRIVGGSESQRHQWPWMVGLMKPSDLTSPFCGGVLLSSSLVMTAAHCTVGSNAGDIMVRLGEYDFNRTDDDSHQDIKVSQIIQHPMYNKLNNQNDISLLRLSSQAELGDDVNPICLPNPKTSITGKSATVAGWGSTKYGGDTSSVLRQVQVPVMKTPDCYKAFNKNITELFICAGTRAGGKDSCQGDSGGPLMIEDTNHRWHSIGIVSWGIRCAEPGLPGVYTRVSKFLDWIKTNGL